MSLSQKHHDTIFFLLNNEEYSVIYLSASGFSCGLATVLFHYRSLRAHVQCD